MTYELHEMDCRLAMSLLIEPDSMDSIVCDPPYGLSKEPGMAEVLRHWLAGDDYTHGGSGFMGKTWDSFVPGPSVWREAYRVLKPGGYLIAFFGTRTYDLGTLAIRLAGFEIRDQLAWVFGSGFPKSLDVSKAIDKAAGAERTEVIGKSSRHGGGIVGNGTSYEVNPHVPDIYAPATDAAKQWQGWGTALKPAYEPIVLARKPLSERTVAANVLTHGTGGLNVDGCRIAGGGPSSHGGARRKSLHDGGMLTGTEDYIQSPLGRWPANLCHDGSDEVLARFPGDGDASAARFFYAPKASKADRSEGLDGFTARAEAAHRRTNIAETGDNPYLRGVTERLNTHPTVKPTDLMRWLCRLVTPPGGTVFDPFTGSGSTGKAAIAEGFNFVGCEMTPEYADIARARLDHALTVRRG